MKKGLSFLEILVSSIKALPKLLNQNPLKYQLFLDKQFCL